MSKKANTTSKPTEEPVKPNMKVVYSVIIIVIAFCLFVVTSFINNLSGSTSKSETKLALKAPNSALVAAMPSLGPLLKSQEIKTTLDEASRTAQFSLNSAQAKEIKKNQSVMLYNKDNKILYHLGKVKELITAESLTSGKISIPAQIEFSTLSEEMQILTLKNYKTKRIPITALQQDEDKGPYVWVAEKPKKDVEISEQGNVVIDRHPELMGNTTKLSVKKYFLRPLNNNGVLIDLGNRIPINTIVILDPQNLQAGQFYPVLLTQIDAPTIMPNYSQYLVDGRERATERMIFLRKEIAKCAANKPPPPVGIASLPEGEKPPSVTPSCAIAANSEDGGCALSGAPADYLKLLGISRLDVGSGACGSN